MRGQDGEWLKQLAQSLLSMQDRLCDAFNISRETLTDILNGTGGVERVVLETNLQEEITICCGDMLFELIHDATYLEGIFMVNDQLKADRMAFAKAYGDFQKSKFRLNAMIPDRYMNAYGEIDELEKVEHKICAVARLMARRAFVYGVQYGKSGILPYCLAGTEKNAWGKNGKVDEIQK